MSTTLEYSDIQKQIIAAVRNRNSDNAIDEVLHSLRDETNAPEVELKRALWDLVLKNHVRLSNDLHLEVIDPSTSNNTRTVAQ